MVSMWQGRYRVPAHFASVTRDCCIQGSTKGRGTMTTQLDYRNINGHAIGTDTVPSDPFTIAQAIVRASLAIQAIHVVGVEGFGAVTIHRERENVSLGWLNPGFAGGPEFAYGHADALAWAITERA